MSIIHMKFMARRYPCLKEKIISVLEGEQEIELIFGNLAKIRVDMSPDGFRGPEAMELLMPGFPLVIWD